MQIAYGVGLEARQREALAPQTSPPGTGHSNAGTTLPSKDATRNKLPVPLPLEVAIRRPRIPRVAALIAGLTRPSNSLITAVKECDISRVCEILNDQRKVVYLNNRSLCKAITWAAGRGEEQVVRLLIEKGADVNACDEDGRTTLHLASENAHEQVVRLLIGKGTDVNACSKYEGTALHLASRKGHEQVVRLLIENGADVNNRDAHGTTALHFASRAEREQVVRLLIQKGANVNIRNADGKTAVDFASQNRHKQVVQLLQTHHK